MNTDKLVELFKTEVEKLEKEAYERGRRDAFEKSKEFSDALESVAIIEQQVQPLSANQQRKELIEQSREFITTHKNARGGLTNRLGYEDTCGIICDAEFVVNEEKRTVVCLLRWQIGRYITSKGIAKCHPDEVFNADIGKAIALARALEIDVPEEFLNAVQPDDFAVGQISKSLYGTVLKITKLDEVNRKAWTGNSYWNYDALKRDLTKIINDTNAQYEVR